MSDDNETVEQVCESVEYLCGTDGGGLEIFGEHINPISLAERILAAHNREIAAKDAEIRELTKELLKKYAKDGVPLEAHNADMAASNREIMSLRALVKEMTDKLHSDYCCEDGSYFDGCDITDICHNAGTCALVARAREVVK